MKQRKIFVTGTDTEVGKTFFTAALVTALQQHYSVIGLKPVAAGCEWREERWQNEDALQLMEAMQTNHNYADINPIALQPPIAPHIAAKQANIELSVATLQKACPLENLPQDYVIVEGAGGWLVPLNDEETFADYVEKQNLDVILVVGLKLGCINHALLTANNVLSRGLNLVGWVANHIDPDMLNQQENIETLNNRLNCPLIAEIPYIEDNKPILSASRYVNIDAVSRAKP